MRRKYFGWAIAMIATLGPMQAWGGDREIAEQIITRLKVDRDSGALKDFTLDMQVDQGVVCFRGNVSHPGQKERVLQAAEGIEGIAEVVDELTVSGSRSAEEPRIVKPQGPVEAISESPGQADPGAAATAGAENEAKGNFSFRQALAGGAAASSSDSTVVPGEIRPASAVEPAGEADQQVTSAVVTALGQAQKRGRLKGFGVEVKSQDGVVQLTGLANSAAQRDLIVRIAEQTRGVAGVRDAITVREEQPSVPQPPVLQPAAARGGGSPQTRMAAARAQAGPAAAGRAQMAPHRMAAGRRPAMPVGHAAPGHGGPAMAAGAAAGAGRAAPVPAAPVPAAGAPRHDSPYLPNHAWPGYAAYPNYAAVTYPQQYSPSAFPYIGPFYPYPQVPLGWRKVSLEWDDGWWYLDFTDK